MGLMSSVYFLKGKFMNVEKKYYLSYRRYVSRFESYLWGGWFCLVSLAILICGAFFVFNEIIFFSCDIYSIAYAVIVLCASIVSSYASIIVSYRFFCYNILSVSNIKIAKSSIILSIKPNATLVILSEFDTTLIRNNNGCWITDIKTNNSYFFSSEMLKKLMKDANTDNFLFYGYALDSTSKHR